MTESRPQATRAFQTPAVRLALEWLVTRLLVITAVAAFPGGRDAYLSSDIGVFWSAATSGQPLVEALPEYPGLARLLAPVGGQFDDQASFGLAWLSAMLVIDAFLTLILASHDHRSARIWVYGGAALGPLVWLRFDLLVAILIVGALLRRGQSPGFSGALLGLAVLLKAWPIVLAAALLPGIHRLRWSTGLGLTVLGGVALDALVAGPRSVISPWTNQAERGVQIESTFATPVLVARAGDEPDVVVQFTDRAYHLTLDFGVVPTVVSIGILLAAVIAVFAVCNRDRESPNSDPRIIGAALLATTAVVANPVFSPQYVMWFLPLLAVAATSPALPRGTAWLGVIAAGLTQLIYPWFYRDVVELEPWAVALVAGRNALVVVVAGWLLTALVRTRSPGQHAAAGVLADSPHDQHMATEIDAS